MKFEGIAKCLKVVQVQILVFSFSSVCQSGYDGLQSDVQCLGKSTSFMHFPSIIQFTILQEE